MSGPPDQVLELLGVRRHQVVAVKDVPLGNGNWLVETAGGQRFVLRRYHARATWEDLAYEHAVLGHLATSGWAVPVAVSEPVSWQDRWYCLTRYVPGEAVTAEDASQRSRRGRDLGRLHLALRGLDERIEQRPGWRPQHTAVTVHAADDWEECIRGLASVSPRLASWAQAAATQARDSLAAIGAADLPVMVVHGDFAEWNVHYEYGRLAGVIDFGLAHVDTRPYELAIARTYRAPQAVDAYRAELAAGGWPLSELEEAAIAPVYGAFRVGMAASEMEDARITGSYDLAMIERQLSRTGTTAPLRETRQRLRIRGAFLGVQKLISVVGYPASEGTHRPVGEALAQADKRVFDPGRCFSIGVPGNEPVAGQAAQRFSQDLVADALESAGAAEGALSGIPLIDPVNAVAHGVGVLRTPPGVAAAQQIAAIAQGAHVVKAFHLFPASQWTPSSGQAPVTVAMCGDDPAALRTVGQLVRDAGGVPAALGPLDRTRQLEEVAGFVIGLAFAGVDPRYVIPSVPMPAASGDPGYRP